MRLRRVRKRLNPLAPGSHEPDVAMVAAIASGRVDTWQHFVSTHSNLILKVLRQVLFLEDDDEVHDVYVKLLVDLHDRKLEQYQGNASLSTWLVFVARGYGLDYVRHKRGRPRPPAGYDRLTEREKLVYRWHFVEGVSFSAVLELLNWDSERTTIDELVDSIQRIEDEIDPRTLSRLDRERAARNAGHGSWRELQYVLHMRLAYISRAESDGDEAFTRLEIEDLRRRLAALRENLCPEEREVINLRFVEGLNAREIAKRVGWATPRRVYSLIESALGRMRSGMDRAGDEQKDTGT